MPKNPPLALWGAALFVSWNALLLFFLWARPPPNPAPPPDPRLTAEVIRLAQDAETQLEQQKELLQQIQRWVPPPRRRRRPPPKTPPQNPLLDPPFNPHPPPQAPPNPLAPLPTPTLTLTPPPAVPVLPVLVLACDRSSVRRCLDALLRYRPSAQRFPIIVSQDCQHAETAAVISSYGAAISHLRPPHGAEAPPVPAEHRKFVGYYRISRHYRWALGHVFRVLRHRAAIVVEDDLEVAPDFYEYFQAVYPILRSDRSLWCASAWHDNGKEQLVDTARPELLYRTDFFPGLGWLLTAELWDELEPKWPPAFWDDWMRQPEQRRGRACVRPEVSRTVTFGRKGVSHGQFFDQHLRFMALNRRFVPFTRIDLSYLRRDAFDRRWAAQLRAASPVRLDDLRRPPPPPEGAGEGAPAGAGEGPGGGGALRLRYAGRDAFRAAAKALGLMDDLKAGVPRAAYRGVVTCLHRGRRVYLAPDDGWEGYDPTWG